MQKIKAIIFDLDGTLINSIDYHHQAYVQALKDTGIKLTKTDFKKLLGIPARELLVKILQEHKKEKFLEEIYQAKYQIADAHSDKVPLNKNALNILKWLKKNNIKVALATSSSKDFTRKILKHHQLREYFDTVLSWEDVRKPKPHPEIFSTAAKKLGVFNNECLIIEDAEIGFTAGKQSGIKTVALVGTHSYNVLKEFETDYIIKDLAEIKDFFKS